MKGWHLVSWGEATNIKNKGGLGLREARKGNIALLGKLVWKFLKDPQCLWVQQMQQIYLKGTPFFEYEIKGPVSVAWRSIIKARDELREDFSFMLQHGDTSLWYANWSGLGPLCNHVPFVHISDVELKLSDIWDKGWCWNRLWTVIPQETRIQLETLDGPTGTEFPDAWRWKHSPDGCYTVASSYSRLRDQTHDGVEHTVWKKLWKLHIPEKYKFLLWLCMHNALPVNAHRFACHLSPSPACCRCSHPVEDGLHCLRDCPHSKEIWLRSGCALPNSFFTDCLWTWVEGMVNHAAVEAFIHVLWWVWRWRNNMAMSNEAWTMDYVQRQIEGTRPVSSWLLSSLGASKADTTFIPPPLGWCALHVDGSFDRKSSRMSCGGLLRDHHGKWVVGFASYEGDGEVFLSELIAVIRGLTLAWNQGIRKLICTSDCLKLVEALNGSRSLNLYSYASYLTEAKSLIQQDWEVTLQHKTREHNLPADALAKLGLRLRLDLCTWTTPPPELVPLVGCG